MKITTTQMDPDEDSSAALPSHPLDVKPSGNAFEAGSDIRAALGSLASLDDELINQILEALDGRALRQVGATCKALYAFSRAEDLWKSLLIEYELPTASRDIPSLLGIFLFRSFQPVRSEPSLLRLAVSSGKLLEAPGPGWALGAAAISSSQRIGRRMSRAMDFFRIFSIVLSNVRTCHCLHTASALPSITA